MCQTIEEAASRYEGVRWIPGGNTINGVDCIGLVIAIAFDIGLYIKGQIEVPKYRQIPSGNLMLQTISRYLKRVPQPQLGSVITFAQQGTPLYHVGVIGEHHFYHAALEHEKVVKTSITEMVLQDRRACFVFEKPEDRG